ncbi:MAG TPA: cyclic lactone autoinducer peptide [Bacillus bacterium]|nr:cyclic lactone autoinducer peptide [Bacillus sp. (in: firmicutes)]
MKLSHFFTSIATLLVTIAKTEASAASFFLVYDTKVPKELQTKVRKNH